MKVLYLLSLLIFINSYSQEQNFMIEINENTLDQEYSNYDPSWFNKITLNKIYESNEKSKFVFFDNQINHLIFVVENGFIKRIKIIINNKNNLLISDKMIAKYGNYTFDNTVIVQKKNINTTQLMSWHTKELRLSKSKKENEKNSEKGEGKILVWNKSNYVITYDEKNNNIIIIFQSK